MSGLVIVLGGNSNTGKSTAARRLANELGLQHREVDAIRIAEEARHPAGATIRRFVDSVRRETALQAVRANIACLAILMSGCAIGMDESTARPSISATPEQTPLSSSVTTPSVPTDGQGQCSTPEFEISYPEDWFVHPAQEETGVEECTLFAARPFQARRTDDAGWLGPQLVLRLAHGCQGTFEVVLKERELRVDGFPAWARTMAVGEGQNAGEPTAYEYTVNLAPEDPCESGRWFFGRTELQAPGDHDENSRVLDIMMASLQFSD